MILSKINIEDSVHDFVPEPSFLKEKIPARPRPDELQPLHLLVTVETGHSNLEVFDYLNKRIRSPKLTSVTFVRFGRNSYLVKVSKPQGYKLQGVFNTLRGI